MSEVERVEWTLFNGPVGGQIEMDSYGFSMGSACQVLDILKNKFLVMVPDPNSKRGHRKARAQWRAHIKSLGMKTLTEKGRKRAAKKRGSPTLHLRDPASVDCTDAIYIEVPHEMAMKILVLGELP